MAEVEVTDVPEQSRWEAHIGRDLAGFLQYRSLRGRIANVHTEVLPQFAGQGVGSALARAALDRARADGLSVLPFCPFVRGWMGEHAEYVELVPARQRGAFELTA